MLPVPELVRFDAGLDEQFHHPVADAAAEAWGLERPVFVRSSASHVVVAAAPDRPGRVVLRLRPDTGSHGAVLARGARAAATWAACGAPAVPALPSLTDRLVERVDGYVAMAMPVVDGGTLDEGGLPEQAEQWGAALARLHLARQAYDDLPHATDLLADAVGAVGAAGVAGVADPALAGVVAALQERLAQLPRTEDVHGTLHGDPEADNVVRGAAGPTFVDPDEVRRGWFASDVAFALRDWAPPAGVPDTTAEVARRFLAGYGEVRPLHEDELGWLPLFARASAIESWAALAPHLAAAPDPGWPTWATELDGRLRARVGELREALLVAGDGGAT